MFLRLVSIAMFMLVTMSACNDGSSLTKTHDTANMDMTIQVHTYSNEKELNRAVSKLEQAPEYEVDGLAQWRVDAMGNVRRCDIHVVEPSTSLDHGQMETWGHELMHCVYGTYHREGQR